jgi:hypothetical protein
VLVDLVTVCFLPLWLLNRPSVSRGSAPRVAVSARSSWFRSAVCFSWLHSLHLLLSSDRAQEHSSGDLTRERRAIVFRPRAGKLHPDSHSNPACCTPSAAAPDSLHDWFFCSLQGFLSSVTSAAPWCCCLLSPARRLAVCHL